MRAPGRPRAEGEPPCRKPRSAFFAKIEEGGRRKSNARSRPPLPRRVQLIRLERDPPPLVAAAVLVGDEEIEKAGAEEGPPVHAVVVVGLELGVERRRAEDVRAAPETPASATSSSGVFRRRPSRPRRLLVYGAEHVPVAVPAPLDRHEPAVLARHVQHGHLDRGGPGAAVALAQEKRLEHPFIVVRVVGPLRSVCSGTTPAR